MTKQKCETVGVKAKDSRLKVKVKAQHSTSERFQAIVKAKGQKNCYVEVFLCRRLYAMRVSAENKRFSFCIVRRRFVAAVYSSDSKDCSQRCVPHASRRSLPGSLTRPACGWPGQVLPGGSNTPRSVWSAEQRCWWSVVRLLARCPPFGGWSLRYREDGSCRAFLVAESQQQQQQQPRAAAGLG